MLIVEIGAFKNTVSFDPIVDLEEVIVSILELKELWFKGKIQSHRKQISEPDFDLKSFYRIIILP